MAVGTILRAPGYGMTVLSDGNGLKLKLTPKTLAMIITYVVLVTAGWVTTQNTLSTLAKTTEDHLVAGPHPEQLLVNERAAADRRALHVRIDSLQDQIRLLEDILREDALRRDGGGG